MECEILRVKKTLNNCRFKIPTDPHWEVIGRRIYTMRRCHFSVYRDGVLQYILTQPSLVKQILACIPIISLFYHNPFYFFCDGARCGHWHNWSTLGQTSFEFVFGGNTYILARHSKGVFSLLRNKVQVAVYRWIDFGKYHMKYSPVMEAQHDILILFVALVENYLILDRSFRDPTALYTPHDRVKERIHWLPEDEMEK